MLIVIQPHTGLAPMANFFYQILNKQDTNPEQKSNQHQINASRETNFWQTVSQTWNILSHFNKATTK